MIAKNLESFTGVSIVLENGPEENCVFLTAQTDNRKQERFERLWEANLPLIRKFANKINENPVQAEDSVQDAAVRAFLRFDKFQNTGIFIRWVRLIVFQVSIDNSRRQKKTVDFELEEVLTREHCGVDIDEFLQCQILFDKLKPIDQQIVKLVSEGYKYWEMVNILDITEATIKMRLQRLRRKNKEAA